MSKKKRKLTKGVASEFKDIDYWNKLNDTEKEFLTDFMHAYYGKDYNNGSLKTQEQKSEAIRNNNSLNRDALNVSRSKGTLKYEPFVKHRLKYDDTDEPWEEVYKVIGPDAAAKEVVNVTLKELGLAYTTRNADVCMRLYYRIKKLLRYIRLEKHKTRK